MKEYTEKEEEVTLQLESRVTHRPFYVKIQPTNRLNDNHFHVATERWVEYIDSNNVGSSSLISGSAGNIMMGNNLIGRVSYNGKIWIEDKEVNPRDYRKAFEMSKRRYLPGYIGKLVKSGGSRLRLRGDIYINISASREPKIKPKIENMVKKMVYQMDKESGLYPIKSEYLPLNKLSESWSKMLRDGLKNQTISIPPKPTFEHSLVVQATLPDNSHEYLSVFGINPSDEVSKRYAQSRETLYGIIVEVDKVSTIGNFRGSITILKQELSKRGYLWASSKSKSLQRTSITMGGLKGLGGKSQSLIIEDDVGALRRTLNPFIMGRPVSNTPYTIDEIRLLLEIKGFTLEVSEVDPTRDILVPKFKMLDKVYFIDHTTRKGKAGFIYSINYKKDNQSSSFVYGIDAPSSNPNIRREEGELFRSKEECVDEVFKDVEF